MVPVYLEVPHTHTHTHTHVGQLYVCLLTDEWARPIFGLASDFKSLGRDEREERDYANLSQAKKRRLR